MKVQANSHEMMGMMGEREREREKEREIQIFIHSQSKGHRDIRSKFVYRSYKLPSIR